ncbi:MAG TPA: hypothetical protein VK666_01950 [Chryseolinea sp.]|nr:hypothetical protein [Chryseolinea sp.]
MESKRHGEVEYFILDPAERKLYLQENKGTRNDTLSLEYRGDVLIFNDGKSILNLRSKAYLFRSIDDLHKYIKITEELAYNATEELNMHFDSTFIEGVPGLVRLFLNRTQLKLDFSSLDDINVLDSFLNHRDLKSYSISERNELIAVIGEYIRNAIPGGYWSYLKDGEKILLPVIIDKKGRLYDPAGLVQGQIADAKTPFDFSGFVRMEMRRFR